MAELVAEVERAVHGHVLDVLKSLVTETQLSYESQQDVDFENASLEELDREVEKLQRKKEELEQHLKTLQGKTVKDLVLNSLEEKVVKHTLTKSIPEEVVDIIPLATKKRKIDLLKVAEAISGYSVFTEGDELVVRLETCFEGRYYEHYQIYLQLQEDEEKIKIHHHTIPYFIPLESLSKQFLNSNFKKFISLISSYLNCYVDRRQQLIQLSENETVELQKIQTSNASDYTTIEAEYQNKKYHMRFYYENLLTTYPSKVVIYSLDSKNEKVGASHLSSFFLENNLKPAFDLAFP